MASQLELKAGTRGILDREGVEPDRNLHLGGRSFYFFDFDDNIATLLTPLHLRNFKTGHEVSVSSREYARISNLLGQPGPWKDFGLDWNEDTGSFRSFRDHTREQLQALGKRRQLFVEDVLQAMDVGGNSVWKGPSWNCFLHATHNERPLSLITARGHHPETLKEGIRCFVEAQHLPKEPNYLSVFPVNHVETRKNLGDLDLKLSTPQLKKMAIRKSVELAFEQYGNNSHHRFGMSDDDPQNLELIFEVMRELKKDFPDNGFFVIETTGEGFVKHEVTSSGARDQIYASAEQLVLDFELAEKPSSER